MAELSPAAKAVLDAVTARLDFDARYHSHSAAAAALCAVADQVAPREEPRGLSASREECFASAIRSAIRHQILAIATELLQEPENND